MPEGVEYQQIFDEAGRGWLSELEGTESTFDADAGRYMPYKDQAGIWTVGHGHAIREGSGPARGEAVPERFANGLTKEEADRLYVEDLAKVERAIQRTVKAPLTRRQYNALVSFGFNVGTEAFKDSTLLKKLNAKDYDGAAQELERWKFVTQDDKKVESKGLANRRAAEMRMWRGEK